MTPFVRFCLVGGLGFLTDTAVLFGLVRVGLPAVPSKALSFAVAVLVTFQCNRFWAFGDAPRGPPLATLLAYLGVQTTGFVINGAIFALGQAMLPPIDGKLLLCAILASAGALMVNYLGARRLVFRKP